MLQRSSHQTAGGIGATHITVDQKNQIRLIPVTFLDFTGVLSSRLQKDRGGNMKVADV